MDAIFFGYDDNNYVINTISRAFGGKQIDYSLPDLEPITTYLVPSEYRQRVFRNCDAGDFTLNGRPVNLAEFIFDNQLRRADLKTILKLKVGGALEFGGGAAPSMLLRRVK
jgi:hypothetical protein